MGLVVLFKQECVCELYVSYSNCAENTFIVEEFIHYYACKCSDGWKGSVCTNGTYITLSKSYSMNCVWFYLQMKERELDYKKSMEQLLKDKDDANRQLKMMQEGERISNIYHTRYIYVGITPCQGIKKYCHHSEGILVAHFILQVDIIPWRWQWFVITVKTDFRQICPYCIIQRLALIHMLVKCTTEMLCYK